MFTFRTFLENSFRILVEFKWNVGFMEFYIGHERMELMCTNAPKTFQHKKKCCFVCSFFAYNTVKRELGGGRERELEKGNSRSIESTNKFVFGIVLNTDRFYIDRIEMTGGKGVVRLCDSPRKRSTRC